MKNEDRVSYEILRSLRKILRKTAQHSRQIARDTGLSVPQLLCLRAIADAGSKGEVTGATVSEAVQLSAPTVSRILDRLENAGLILRERRSKDRRKVCLSLTKDARKQLKNLPTPLHEQFLSRLTSLDQKHQELLLQSLNQLVDMMEAADVEAAPMLTTGTDAHASPPAE